MPLSFAVYTELSLFMSHYAIYAITHHTISLRLLAVCFECCSFLLTMALHPIGHLLTSSIHDVIMCLLSVF